MLTILIAVAVLACTGFGFWVGLKCGRLDAAADILLDRSLPTMTALYASHVALGTRRNPYKRPAAPPPHAPAAEVRP